MSYEPVYTKTLRAESPYVKTFFWLWPIDPSNLNTCWLFWGTVLAPFNLIVRIICAPFYYCGRAIVRKIDEKQEDSYENYSEYLEKARKRRELIRAKKERRQKRFERILDAASPIWNKIRWPLAVLGSLGILFGLTLLGILIVNNIIDVLIGLSFAVATVIVGVLIILAVAFIMNSYDKEGFVKEFSESVKGGYWSVKNRTCAKYIIKD